MIMNEELKQKLIENSSDLLDFLKESGKFAKEQAPILLQEILTFEILDSVGWIAIAFAAPMVLLWCARKVNNSDGDFIPRDFSGVLGLFACIAAALGVVIVVFQVYDILKVIFAPRLFLLNYVAGMLNGGCDK